MDRSSSDVEHTLWRVPFKNKFAEAFVVRELTNMEEVEAARVARTKGPFLTPEEVGRAVFLEEVAFSIVAVQRPGASEVEPVEEPFAEFHQWGARLRLLAMRAYKALNGLSDEEEAVFQAGAQPWPPVATP